ncbi:hypothetical protein YA64_017500 [Acinetobacter pittii]|nr:hypothetical protein YA64_017500 [Acinetobacter pittii]
MSKIPLIIIGSGASVPYGIPGMWQLGQYLKNSSLPDNCKLDHHLECWQKFLELIETTDLESALTQIQAPDEITQHIVNTTWKYLNHYDLDIFEQVIMNRDFLTLTRLYAYLFNSSQKEINVITPNYDRITEYAADAGNYAVFTGFNYGLIASRNLNKKQKIIVGNDQVRTVNIWKVHGSFGWFEDNYKIATALPPLSKIPNGLSPLIVTPGIEKYRITSQEPFRTIIQGADDAITRAAAFFCIGYGFNDLHLQAKIVERCDYEKVPLILITKEITDTAKKFFSSGRCKSYIAIEEFKDGIKVYTHEVPDGMEYPDDEPVWQLNEFMNLIC